MCHLTLDDLMRYCIFIFQNSRYVSSANSSRRGSDASTDDTRDIRVCGHYDYITLVIALTNCID